MPHFDAVLFDLDGTLLYTLPDIHAAVCRALALNGYGAHTMEDTRRFVGTGSRELVRKSLPADASPEEVDRVLVTYRAEYKAALRKWPTPIIFTHAADNLASIDEEIGVL